MSEPLAETIGRACIDAIVADFYAQVRVHPQLAGPFARVQDWPAHQAHIAHFWWTVLGGDAYLPVQYRVGPKHQGVGVTVDTLEAWLTLFQSTLRAHLPESQWRPWFDRALKIGESLLLLSQFQPGERLARHHSGSETDG